MTPDDKKELSRQILNNPLFMDILNELETAAIETGINAPPAEDSLRFSAMAEVRAIRSFRAKLLTLLGDNRPRTGAPV